MTRTLYLDCEMGAAGDMLAAALLELLPDPQGFIAEFNSLGLPGVRVGATRTSKLGVGGTSFQVLVNGVAEQADPDHRHQHNHHVEQAQTDHLPGRSPDAGHRHDHGSEQATGHPHRHGDLSRITDIITGLGLPKTVQDDALAVYRLIAEAESQIHQVPVSEIHFHEVGALDAIADITAVCLLLARLAPQRVIASPIRVGAGQVRCAHGLMPVPAPATALILTGIPTYAGEIRGELCTPTGAALVRHFAHEFGVMPPLRADRIGYGMGKKDFTAVNCVRALLGDAWDAGDESTGDEVVLELSCNLDDMTAEAIGFAMDALLTAGALEVYTLSAGMKKCRPGTVLTVLCRPGDRARLVKAIFAHTVTLGIREQTMRRHTLTRTQTDVPTRFGPIRRKLAHGHGVRRAKYEYDDLARAAETAGLGLAEVLALIEQDAAES